MPIALYYPYSQISNLSLIRTALLLWDGIEYITPSYGHESRAIYDRHYCEALEIIGRPHRPTPEEQTIAHHRLKGLLDVGLPESFSLLAARDDGNDHRDHPLSLYHMYGEKLAHRTWEMLSERGLAKQDHHSYEFGLAGPLGLLAMSILAESCAGSTRLRVTDQPDAYAWLDEELTRSMGGQYVRGLDPSQVAPSYDRLVTLSVKVINTDEVPIESLLEMRRREAIGRGGSDYHKFRQNYFTAIRDHVTRLAGAKTSRDVMELERLFKEEMRSDLKQLKAELRLEARKTLLSKEIGVAALAVAGALSEPIAGLTGVSAVGAAIGVGALVNLKGQYVAASKKILDSHSMSWLYKLPKRSLMQRFKKRKSEG